jgi:hypothetical protein
MRTLLLALLLLAQPAGDADSLSVAGWKQVKKTDDGILVYRRGVPGSPVLAFKGEGDVDAPLDKVATIVFDTTRAAEWIADLKESRIVRWTGDTEFVEYDHIGTPFILKDRDFVSTVSFSVKPGEVKFHYASTTDPSLPEKRYVRGDLMDTTYLLTAIDAGHTHVVADFHCDPKGWIPSFVANWAQADWPVDTFRGLRRQAAKPDVSVDPRFATRSSP